MLNKEVLDVPLFYDNDRHIKFLHTNLNKLHNNLVEISKPLDTVHRSNLFVDNEQIFVFALDNSDHLHTDVELFLSNVLHAADNALVCVSFHSHAIQVH